MPSHGRDKFWEFFVSEYDLRPVLAPVIEAAYIEDADTLEALESSGSSAHEEAAERVRRNTLRRDLLAAFLERQIGCDTIEFTHDPDAGDDPAIDHATLTATLTRFFDGAFDQWRYGTEPPAQPLFNDDFADPAETRAFIAAVTDAVTAAVANGTVEVTAEEPYDSCSGCGGYHNVNYDCG